MSKVYRFNSRLDRFKSFRIIVEGFIQQVINYIQALLTVNTITTSGSPIFYGDMVFINYYEDTGGWSASPADMDASTLYAVEFGELPQP